jgi:hypothetical protein
LQKQIDDLKAMIVSGNSSSLSSINGQLSTASLEQNIPNPFNQSTVIKYYISSNFHSAQLIVTDLNGRNLKTFEIKNAGYGQQTIAANELTSGNYQYTLILDGRIIASKKMELLH